MIAADTNVLVRFLINDDPDQNRRAKNLFDKNRIFISATVLLETEWVLRGAYGQTCARILESFQALLGMQGVAVEDAGRLAGALVWYESGLDFADALHLASASAAQTFATFDRRLIRRAGKLNVAPAVVAA